MVLLELVETRPSASRIIPVQGTILRIRHGCPLDQHESPRLTLRAPEPFSGYDMDRLAAARMAHGIPGGRPRIRPRRRGPRPPRGAAHDRTGDRPVRAPSTPPR